MGQRLKLGEVHVERVRHNQNEKIVSPLQRLSNGLHWAIFIIFIDFFQFKNEKIVSPIKRLFIETVSTHLITFSEESALT